MPNSMMDQLKKAGLVDKKKQQQVKKEKHKARRKPDNSNATAAEQAKAIARDAELQKRARDLALNRQRKEEAEQAATAAQIKQLIETHRLPLDDGDIAFHFTYNKRIKQLYVSAKIQRQLSAGDLAIAVMNEKFDLIPRPIAEKIEQRRGADHLIWVNATDDNRPSDDDPYADYQIPDDLMW
jgi:uncharacterized protein YaiL (DUF2058 family)